MSGFAINKADMKLQLKKTVALSGLFAVSVAVSHAQYYLAGDFQGWNASGNQMTAGPNPGEYSYTNSGGGTAGTYANVKVTDGTFDNTWPGSNMKVLYDSTGSFVVHFWPGTFSDGWTPSANRVGYDDPDNDPGWAIAGSFNGWGTPSTMTSLGNGVYTNNITVATAGSYAFQFRSPATSTAIYLGADFGNSSANAGFLATSSPQTLPAALDLPNGRWLVPTPPPPTNNVTFQVNLSAQVALGNFVPGTGTITVSGDFEGWDNGIAMTNNPTLSGNATNIYTCVAPVVSYLPDPNPINYKFRMNGGWESPASTSGNNRQATITSGSQVLPLVYYNDNSIYDLVLSPTTVTFTLYMTNGTPDKNGYSFNNSSDTLWINGDFLNNWNGGTWPGPVGNFPAAQQMIEVGSSDYYTNSFVIPAGNSIYLNYKYAIDSEDDENGFGTNHVREIRSYGPAYAMPTDVWSTTVVNTNANSSPYPNPGIASTNIVEPDYGYLAIQPPTGGKLPITWLGRPGVVLQNTASLTGGSWQTNNGTDGTQATNWPNAGGTQFFKLMKKQ